MNLFGLKTDRLREVNGRGIADRSGCPQLLVTEAANVIDALRAEVRRLHFKLGECCPACGFDQPQCDCRKPEDGG